LYKGAQPTDTVRRILSFKGVLYLKHLLRGVKLGLFDEATAMTKFQEWHASHENAVLKRKEEHKKQQRDRRKEAQAVVKKVEETKEAPAAEPAVEKAEAATPAAPPIEAES
jgi:small subunit ribosomal protein S16